MPTPSPASAPIPIPNSTPTPPPLRHHSEKLYLLSLINAQREEAGAPPLVLGDNAAAQLHAEDSLENCFLSHWGSNGLNPEMRYTLAGGHQSYHTFLTGLNYCITSSDGYRAKSDIKTEILNWTENLAEDNPDVLDRRNKKVNIGLAWDTYNSTFVLGFEGDYIEYDRLPNIENGILSLSGATGNGASFPNDTDLGIDVHYDPPPHPLTRGQLSRTYSRAYLRVASLRPPLAAPGYYPEHWYSTTYRGCLHPYRLPPDAPAPISYNESHQLTREARDAWLACPAQTLTVPWITASQWTASGQQFSAAADLAEVISQHGNGVYTIVVWASAAGERIPISDYSIFHGTTPPTGYPATQ